MKLRQAVGHGFAAKLRHCAMLALALSLIGCAKSNDASSQHPMISEVMPLVNSTNVIHVVPVEGLERPLQLVLADAVAASLRDIDRPALLSASANDRGPTVRGRVEKSRERGSIVWVNATWQLLAPYGTAVAEKKHEVVIDKRLWDEQAVEVVNLLIRESMPTIADMVADHVGPLNATEIAEASPTQIVNEPATVMSRTGAVQRAKTPATSDLVAAPARQEPPEAEGEALTTMQQRQAMAGQQAAVEPVEPASVQAMEMPNYASPAAADPADPAVITEPLAEAMVDPEKVESMDTAPEAASRPPVSLSPKDSNIVDKLTPKPSPETTMEMRTQEMPAVADAPGPTEKAEENDDAPPAEPPKPPKMMAVENPKSPESLTLEAGISMPQRDPPVVWGRPSFLVRPVKGAPGDGDAALTSAIKAALRSRDVTITEDPRQAGYEVIGSVDVGVAVNGRQRAKINWTVNTIGGDEVGKAVQENIVAAGSLEGAWGRVAEIVSLAAADGIQALFNAPKRQATAAGYVPEFPKIPKLPRMPGRALPPAPN